jgi:hypothetical protein
MRVKMTTLECGPLGTFNIGDEREVSDSHGAALVAARSAVDVTVYEKAVVVPVEVAAVVVDETAVAPVVENRGKRGGKR